MGSKLETLESSKVKLTIKVDKDDFCKAMDSAYYKVRKSITIPGFRKGKAPKPIIERHYGESVFYEDAFDEVFPDAYWAAVKEHELEVVDQPGIDIETIGADQDLVFTAEVTVKPGIELGKYKGISIEVTEQKVTDEDVDAEIERARDKVSRWVDVEKKVQNGDRVVIDYKGLLEGQPFDGGTAEGYSLEIGSNTFIPGFEEQLVGMEPGEEKNINVTFPEQYHSEELKGKPVVFEVKVNTVKQKELPELDDEFAKDISEFDTFEEYKVDVKKKLEDAAKSRTDNEINNLLVQKVVDDSKVEIPQCMIDRQIDSMVQEMGYRLSYQGISLQDYLRMTNTDMDTFKGQYAGEAEIRVKTHLAMEALRKAEQVEAADEDVENEIKKMAEDGSRSVEDIKKTLKDRDYDYIKDNIETNKILDILKENAKIKKKAAKKKSKTENSKNEGDAQ